MLVTYSIVLEIVSLCDFTPVVLLDISILPLFLFCVVIRRTNVEQQVTTAKPVSHLKPLRQNKEHVPRLVFDGHRCSAIPMNAPLGIDPFREPVMLQPRVGAWWVTTAEGLFRFPPVRRATDLAKSHPEAAFTVRGGLLDNVLHPLYLDSKGDLWFAAWRTAMGAHELYRWENATDTVQKVSTTGALSLKHKEVTALPRIARVNSG